jgi:hypothetical protein
VLERGLSLEVVMQKTPYVNADEVAILRLLLRLGGHCTNFFAVEGLVLHEDTYRESTVLDVFAGSSHGDISALAAYHAPPAVHR